MVESLMTSSGDSVVQESAIGHGSAVVTAEVNRLSFSWDWLDLDGSNRRLVITVNPRLRVGTQLDLEAKAVDVEEPDDRAEPRIALATLELADRLAMQAGGDRLRLLAPALAFAQRVQRPAHVEQRSLEYGLEIRVIVTAAVDAPEGTTGPSVIAAAATLHLSISHASV
jgi:hypothetical protein